MPRTWQRRCSPCIAVAAADDLPEWDKFAYARHHLAHARGIDEQDLRWLHLAWQQAEHAYRTVAAGMPHGVIHGDAHTGNLLIDSDQRAIFCDLDNVAVGPLDWDLTPTAVGSLRFGLGEYRRGV